MKIKVRTRLEFTCTLSDGTELVSFSKAALINTIKNKIRGNSNILSHYAHEIERLNREFDLLQKDLQAVEAME